MLKVGFKEHFLSGLCVLAFVFLSSGVSAQVFTSTAVEEGTYGTPYIYNVTTFSLGSVTITADTPLPPWMTLDDHDDGTATLSGTPPVVGALPTITLRVADASMPILFSTQDINLEIEKAVLTITADNKSRTYGDSNPTLTFTYSGFLNGDTEADLPDPKPTASTGAIESTTAGSATISVSTAAVDESYSYNFVSGTLTINKAHLTAVADNQSRPYFAAEPTYTVHYLGLKNGEPGSVITTPPTFDLSAFSQTSNAGNYPINLVNATGSDENYDFTGYTAGTLTITKIALTAKADDMSRPYGSANPEFTITYTGFVNGDNAGMLADPPEASSGATPTTPVGTAAINVNIVGAQDENYTFIPSAGVLTITKAILTATAEPKTRPYGSADNFTIIYSGFVNGQTIDDITTKPTATANATSSSDAGGSYTITPANGADESYDFVYVTAPLTITKVALTATASNATMVYGTTVPSAFTITYSGFVPGENASVLDQAPVATTDAGAQPEVDTYTITPHDGADVNYSFSYVTGTLSVTRALLTAKADDKTKVYGTANPNYTITYSGFVNGDTEAELDPTRPTATTAPGVNATSPVGNYDITVTGGVDDNYTYTYSLGILSITKATLTATADAKTKVYGALNPPLTITYSGLLNGDLPGQIDSPPDISTTAVQLSPVNTYPITLENGSDNNYIINLVGGTLTVTRATLTITATSQSRPYGSNNPTLTVSYSGFVGTDGPGVFTDALEVTTPATPSSGIGDYAITPAGAAADNYSLVYVAGTLTVTRAVLTVTADNQTRTYGAANPGLTVAYSGFVNTDNAGVVTPGTVVIQAPGAAPTANVGTYNIIPSGFTAANYSFTYVNGTMTITQATITVTANNATRTYGSIEPAFTAILSGFVNSQNSSVFTTQPTGYTDADINSNVGTYPINFHNGAALNYTFSYVPGVLTITKATLVATADSKSKVYRSANPGLTISYTGFKNGQDASVILDPPDASTTAQIDSNVGTYPITLQDGDDENYTFSFVAGTLSITRAGLVVTALDNTRAYGAANPVFTFTYAGFLGSDGPGGIDTPPTMKTDAVPTSVTGNYPIYLNTGAIDNNYSFTYVPGTLSVTKALLTARPNNQSRIYGAVNPSFTITYTGFANSETAAVIDVGAVGATTATVNSVVGTYDITASGASDVNYDFTYNPGTLTINKAPLTLTANNQSKVYGAVNPELTITYSGFQNGETATVLDAPAPAPSTTAGVTSPVGGYPITLSTATDNNYSYTLVPGTLTVTKAVLTVTADNKTRPYNTANPSPFTLTYSGFLNGDNISVFNTPHSAPTGSTTAAMNSPVGNYTINASGGSTANYTLSYVSGTLTVTKATPVVTWLPPSAITYLTPLGAGQLNATASVPGTFDYTPPGGTILNAGAGQVLTVNFTPSDGANYNSVNGTTVTINVNKATPIITWANPAPITYGTALSLATQLNATANTAGTFDYTPPAGTVLNASASPQTLTANFTPSDPANYNPVTGITRQITVNKATPIVTWGNPAPITYGTPLSSTQQNSTFSVPGLPTYIPGAGTILPTGANQPITVTWNPSDATNYNSVNAQVLITVVKATPVISWVNPADITYGTPLATGASNQLRATSSVPGNFDYTPGAGTILPAGSGQTLTAVFTPTDQTNYNTVTGITATINVNKANPVITWPAPSPITYGTALATGAGNQLNATSSVPGSTTYNPPAGTVLNAGVNQTLTSTFTPTDQSNYNTIVTNRTITVNKATPIITWPTPGAITYGTPLAEGSQLNVTANVPGTPTYTPPAGTILNAGAGQTLSATFTPADGANYTTVTGIQRFITVNKATPVVSWATPLPIKTGVALALGVQLNATSTVPGTPTYTPPAGTSFASEGVYTLHVRWDPTDAVNYNAVPDTQVQLTVSSKENPVITWNDPADITYGTLLTSTQNGASASVAGTYSYAPPNGTRMNAGANQNLTVTFTPTDQVNYNIVTKTVHINVNKATLTATATNTSRNYGAANPSFAITYTGFVGGETAAVIDTPPTATCSAIVSDPAGSTAPIVPAGGSDNNYVFTYANGTLTINKAPLVATADNKTRQYGLSNPTFTISYTGFANGDDEADITPPTASTTALLGSNVGAYPISLTGGAAANYNITLQAGTLTIAKALLIVVGSDLTKAYGQPNPPLTFNYIGFRNGDTPASITTPPNATTTATLTSPVGTYAINIAGGSATNYDLTPFPGSLTITKAPLTAKADNKTRPYGSANPANSITYTGFMNADGPGSITQPTITGPAATTTSDAGTYPIQLSGGSATNYDITLQNGALTVTKAALNAKADNKSRIYGQANPAFTLTVTGFLNGDDINDITPPTASTTATVASPVAAYLITVAGGSATNYSFTFQSGTLTIDPASLIAKANDRTRMYGQANPTLTISYTGFLNGDDAADITPPTASTTASPTSSTGTYSITLAGGTATNYTLTLQSGTLTVAKATLTAKADDKSKVYGTANPSNSISYIGFVNGDDAGDVTAPTIAGPGTTNGSPVGVYPITLSGGSATNYSFVLQNGALTITQAPLTARADNKSRLYGGTNPPFTITYTGFVGGDTQSSITQPVASTVAIATSDVGTYAITLSGTTANYAFTFQSGTLTVNKATVAVTADNQTKTYGAANPTLTMSYSGLVNSETTAVIDTPPTATTTATSASPIGNYPITLTGGTDNNYLFTYTSGTLTVSKAPLTARADNKQRFYGEPNPPNSITYTGFVNGDTPSSITQPVAGTAANATSPLGDYPIVLTGGSAANYTITLQPGILSVIPAQLTVTAVNQSKTYGAANPTLTLNYTGFATGHSINDIDVLPVASTTATISSNVGTYPITVAGGSDSNYSFVYASGTLTVNRAPLTATADSKTTTYGTIPPLTVTYSGFVNGENVSVLDTPPLIATTANATSAPGPYAITLTDGIDNNYLITNVEGSMTIGKAILTAKADDKIRNTGVANPALTITYSGFANNETTDVVDVLPTASTTATTASAAGIYPIDVAGGSDDNYDFNYQAGTLAIVLDTPPVVKNFQVDAEEDVRFDFTAALFAANTTDDANGKIFYIKVLSLPQNGSLFSGAARVTAGEEVPVTNGQLSELYYLSNSNYNGNDSFNWNVFDGSYLAVTPASVTMVVKPVNDPPVLSNIESETIAYSPGDEPVHITEQLIINDVDDGYVVSASIKISTNYTKGDELTIKATPGEPAETEIQSTYDSNTGELKLTGTAARAKYESLLRKVSYSSPVTGEATISEKNIVIIVRDSAADSNMASRIVRITEVLPELDLVNSFTPNGDGVNDEWDILNLQSYSAIAINIYDFNGTKVFSCGTKDCKWDGTINGKALPAGPYSYTIDLNDGKRRYQGTVTILK